MGQPDVANQDALIQQRLPGDLLVREPAEEHEVGVAGHRVQAHLGEVGHDAVTLGLEELDGGQKAVRVLQGRAGDRLRRGREVVRQADQSQRLGELGIGRQVTQTSPAKANALLMVRVTTSRPRPSSRVNALGVPGRANSA